MAVIDLNADLGELSGAEGRALDAAILAHVTSVSIACGGHAGDEDTMAATLDAAKAAGVAAGAHPSYPDRDNFGRTAMRMSPASLAETIESQVAALVRLAEDKGIALQHIKPHGALYHDARTGPAAGILSACAEHHGLVLFGAPTGMMVRAAQDSGVPYIAEGFADRAYRAGNLMPRGELGAVIDDEEAQAAQALALAHGAKLPCGEGPPAAVRTICLHGDTPGAAAAAARLRAALETAGVTLRAPGPPR